MLRLTTISLALSISLCQPAQSQQQQADFIVAVVNTEPITFNELRLELQRAQQQIAQQRRPQPERAALTREVLDGLISDRLQLQVARETGIRVDDAAVDLAEQNIARQNQFDLAELRSRLKAEGMPLAQFRANLREAQANQDPQSRQINLAQILVAVPDDASPEQIDSLQARAQETLRRAQAGEDFAALARERSDAADRSNGGQMGLRAAARYPTLFVEASAGLAVGGISALLRSGAGFHILKLIELQLPGMPPAAVTQSRARHILLRPGPQLSEAQAREQLTGLRQRLLGGQAFFAVLAREYSQDSSAAQGGDLGWASPGMFVPEFEQVMNQLALGQVSEPLVSRFGVHLIEVLERRRVETSLREQRDAVRAILREKKLEEAFPLWAQDLRARAYVELRELPQ